MKFKENRPFTTPEAAARKLLELANGMEPDHAGRLSVAIINRQFRDAGGSYEEYGAAVNAALAHGWITMHPSGAYPQLSARSATITPLANVKATQRSSFVIALGDFNGTASAQRRGDCDALSRWTEPEDFERN
jgi:hypothetical protein